MARCRCDVARGLVPSGFFSGRGNSTRRSAGVPGGVAGLFVATAALLSPLADTMFAWLKQGSGVPATISLSQVAKDLAETLEVQWPEHSESDHPRPFRLGAFVSVGGGQQPTIAFALLTTGKLLILDGLRG